MATYSGQINSAQDFATAVLTDLGAPITPNNLTTMTNWMAAENPWPPPRNNPLNNGLGSGGGSGLGSYPSLTVAAQYAAENLSADNSGYPAAKAALLANAPEAQFKQAIVNSGWAGGHYQGTDYGAGVTYQGPNASPTGLAANTPAQNAALAAAAAEPGGAAYLQAVQAQKEADAGTAPNATQTAAASDGSLATGSTSIGGVSYSGTNQQTSALSTIEANLNTYGFTPAQVSQLTNWAWGEITNNVDPSQIAIDLQAQPAFTEAFPGFAAANAQLNAQGLPAVSVQTYQGYQASAQAMAQAAGLPAGFINSQNIGQLIGGNVSASELSARINDATTLAINSTPEQQQMFNEYFGTKYGDTGQGGLTTGQIASIALDPTAAEPLIAQQITAAKIGGASVTSGVGGLDVNTALALSQAGITSAQATSAFQNLAPLSALETARPGEGAEAAQGTVSADQLATGQLLGDPAAQRQLQQAQEVAKAPFSGGGGYTGTSRGTAVGSANPNGTGNA